MNTNCFHRHKSRKIVIGVVSFLVVYVLSTGPAMKLEDSGFISQRANTILYAPLIPLAAIPGVRSFMN
jgi:hypothetical protein